MVASTDSPLGGPDHQAVRVVVIDDQHLVRQGIKALLGLSPEVEVLRLLAAGYSNREVAQALHLVEGTVKNHVSAILLKLGVRDRTRAVLRAIELGLINR